MPARPWPSGPGRLLACASFRVYALTDGVAKWSASLDLKCFFPPPQRDKAAAPFTFFPPSIMSAFCFGVRVSVVLGELLAQGFEVTKLSYSNLLQRRSRFQGSLVGVIQKNDQKFTDLK
jgi:hypothetical protein